MNDVRLVEQPRHVQKLQHAIYNAQRRLQSMEREAALLRDQIQGMMLRRWALEHRA